jgi:hypothetical protein
MLGITLISICMAVAVVVDLYYIIKNYEEEE